ncbi:hypothetical protein [Desulfospira joergensenii]|uniref:hypothetical protein n=1 Tax=Desulfospira joergensenii TaxID=53329 RepID=UPI0003B579AD|nr:hypothetical protein [Desulfospira joergensenii]
MKDPKMTKNRAIKTAEEIKDFCKKNGLWCEIHREYKPSLKNITITVSLKVLE